ncbi:MAG: AAA family ATPase [Thermoleophilia bacterium]
MTEFSENAPEITSNATAKIAPSESKTDDNNRAEEAASHITTTSHLYRGSWEEVGFRRLSFADLQMEQGGEGLSFLPVLGLDGIIVKGWSHLLAAAPKTGKTELLTRLIDSWKNDKILLISEEKGSLWVERLKRLGMSWPHVTWVYDFGRGPKKLKSVIEAGDESIVVIDTIRRHFNIRDENDNAEVAAKLAPVLEICEKKGQTAILAHHLRKGGGSHGEGISGGHAFLGCVDIAMELKKVANSSDMREIEVMGRLIDEGGYKYKRTSDGSFEMLGEAGSFTADKMKKRYLEILPIREGDAKSISELDKEHPELAHSSRTLKTNALNELVAEGVAGRNPKDGGQGKTQWYWRIS